MPLSFGKLVSDVGTALRLPELGISEKFGYTPQTFQINAPYGLNPTLAQQQGMVADVNPGYRDPRINWQPTNQVTKQPTTGGGGYSGGVPSQIQQPNYSNLNQQTNDYQNIIEREFQDAMNMYAGQEGILRGQTAQAEGQVATEFGDVSNQLTNEQAVNEASIANQLATGEKSSKSALQNARDLFRQVQQQNIIQTSGLGISSSSVTEALAERLGVETARRMAGITGSMDEIRQNASTELTRVKSHFEGKRTTLAREKANAITTIQSKLTEGLNQINSARDMATTAKARQRADLFYNAQSLAAQMQAKYEDMRMSLEQWYIQKANALQPISQGDWMNQFNASLSNVQSQFNPTQFNTLPSYNVDKYGNYTGQIKVSKKDEEEEDISNPTNPAYWQGGY